MDVADERTWLTLKAAAFQRAAKSTVEHADVIDIYDAVIFQTNAFPNAAIDVW